MQTSRSADAGTTLYSLGGIALLAIVAAAAFFTKPTMASFEEHLRGDLRNEVAASMNRRPGDGVFGAILRVGCTMDIDACVKMVRSRMQVDETDLMVARYVRVLTDKEEKNCLGAFNSWFCTDFRDR